jgi:hypothetical protein
MAREQEERKLEGAEIDASGNKLFKKIENFFYHYKWHVIIIGFFAIVIISGLFQVFGKTEPDAIVTYGGAYAMNSTEKAEVQKVLSQALSKDLNGDGQKKVTIKQFQVCTDEEIKDINDNSKEENEKDPNNDAALLIGGDIAANKKAFYESVNLGFSAILFVGDELYGELVANGRIEKIENIYPAKKPRLEDDGYSYRLGDLEVYRENEALQILPADTRVCLMVKYIHTSQTEYSVMKDAFIDLIK